MMTTMHGDFGDAHATCSGTRESSEDCNTPMIRIPANLASGSFKTGRARLLPSQNAGSERLSGNFDLPARGRCVILTVLLICGVPFEAVAQSSQRNPDRPLVDFPGLDIQAVAGWDRTVDLSAPVPFSFLISNFSDDTIEGQLILTDPLNEKQINLGDIFIGPGSTRRFSSIQALTDWNQCVATFTDGHLIFWRRELPIATGKDFSDDVNYLLFVDDGGRMLQFPIDASAPESSSSQYVPQPGTGRPVLPLAVKSWQMPQHPGPLTVAQAIVFSETADVGMLNDAQWDAVAKWMCLGGTVFASDKSKEIIERLKQTAPLEVQPPVSFEQFAVHRSGCGSIHEYSRPLFSASEPTGSGFIAKAASRLSRRNGIALLEGTHLYYGQSQNADTTRMLVGLVFGGYTFLSGVVTLVLFRLNRRHIAVYTVSVVAAACLAAIVLGAKLRTSRGDLRWVSVTQAAPGGLVQLGKIDVQSAGGRNTQLAVRGKHPDLQLIESNSLNSYGNWYYHSDDARPSYPPFTWQVSRIASEPDTYQIDVPMTPWGVRQLYATAFAPDVQSLKLELDYTPADTSTESANREFGRFSVTATNQLPFDLLECQLILCRTEVSQVSGRMIQSYNQRTGRFQMQSGKSIGELVHAESVAELGDLPQSRTITHVDANLIENASDDWRIGGGRHSGNYPLPRIAFDGGTSAWIVGRISKSPSLSIDDRRSDFEPLQELHLFVQEIPPEDMPEAWMREHQLRLEQEMKAVEATEMSDPPGMALP